MKIIKTLPGDTNFALFKELPELIYSESLMKLKSSESIPEKHLDSCFVLLENEVPKARISVYLNPFLIHEGKKTACFGNYECVEDEQISYQIFNHAKSYCKKLGVEFVIGPMNGSTWENYRFSLNHNAPNFFLEPYHHLYYNEQFLNAGFKTIGNYHSFLDQEVEFNIPGIKEKQEAYEKQGVTFRNVDLDKFEDELESIFELNEIAFKTNLLYSPIEKKDFIQKYLASKQFIDPEFMILAFDENNELLAYYFCVQDFYNTTEKSLIFKSIARNPDPKWRGLGMVIGRMIYLKAKEQGFSSIIHAFMYDEGTSSPISKKFDGNKFKKYRLYGQEVQLGTLLNC